MSQELRLTIELVPSPCWHSNLRKILPRSAWDKLRKQVYAQYKNQCGICNAENVTLDCHEIWQYDDEAHIQKLTGFIALCKMCHLHKHPGFAAGLIAKGQLDADKFHEHFLRVNQCSDEEYAEHSAEVWRIWKNVAPLISSGRLI